MNPHFEATFEDFEITVTKEQILEALQDNKSKHVVLYNKSLKGFRKTATERLKKHLAAIENGEVKALNISMKEPVNYEDQYDARIRMFERASEETFALNAIQYSAIFDDKWDWTSRFHGTNAFYYNSVGD